MIDIEKTVADVKRALEETDHGLAELKRIEADKNRPCGLLQTIGFLEQIQSLVCNTAVLALELYERGKTK